MMMENILRVILKIVNLQEIRTRNPLKIYEIILIKKTGINGKRPIKKYQRRRKILKRLLLNLKNKKRKSPSCNRKSKL